MAITHASMKWYENGAATYIAIDKADKIFEHQKPLKFWHPMVIA